MMWTPTPFNAGFYRFGFNSSGVREVLGVPDHKMIGVTMAVGWPARPFRQVNRRPTSDVTHINTW
jgi:hypothetical protein